MGMRFQEAWAGPMFAGAPKRAAGPPNAPWMEGMRWVETDAIWRGSLSGVVGPERGGCAWVRAVGAVYEGGGEGIDRIKRRLKAALAAGLGLGGGEEEERAMGAARSTWAERRRGEQARVICNAQGRIPGRTTDDRGGAPARLRLSSG